VGQKWVSTSAGRHLSGRRKVNTGPELALRKALHAQGARFRLQRQLARGCTPDVVLPGRHLAIFVDGCFWHGCPKHGRQQPWAGPNAPLWEEKMAHNRERDARSTRLALDLGWTVERVWECDIVRGAALIASRLLETHPVVEQR
jgi:DNA mismatch endonuclease, patch repair protein